MSTIGSVTAVTDASVRAGLAGKGRGDLPGTVFQLLLLGSLLFSLAILFILLADVLMQRRARVRGARPELPDRPPVVQPGERRRLAGHRRHRDPRRDHVACWPSRSASRPRSTSRSTRGDTKLTRFIQINIRNLAGVPSVVYGLLGLTVFVAVFGAVTDTNGRNVHRGRRDARRPRAADRDHHLDRGAPGRAQHDPRGRLRRRGLALGGDPQPGAAVRRAGRPDRAPCSPCRGRWARRPRSCWSARSWGRSRAAPRSPTCSPGRSPRCPVIVYDWSRKPQDEFRQLAAAAIVVLLVITLIANAIAIFLRNRYERAW